MALQSKYQSYLSRPTADALAPSATLNYMPTLASIREPAAILKHLKSQESLLKTKHNDLNAFESESSLCVEVETTIQFINGGGTYLPGLEEYLLANKTVTLPIIHVVSFDQEQKIQQIRLMWDQGCLLKSVDIIGSRGKNWPIYDGKDQARLISTSKGDAAVPSLTSSMNGASLNDEERTGRTETRPGTARSISSASDSTPKGPNHFTKRSSVKPPQRDYQDLFADSAYLPEARDGSPSKAQNRNPLKIGAGKNFHENRLFGDEPEPPPELMKSPEKSSIKPHPKKYSHFEFGDEAPKIEPKAPRSPTKHKHFEFGEEELKIDPKPAKPFRNTAQWNFEDFVTPEKPRATRQQPQGERHFGWSDDEEEAKKPLVHMEHAPKARRDNESHFEFRDDATPMAERVRPRTANARKDLYQDNVMTVPDPTAKETNSSAATAGPPASDKMPLGNITNVNTKGHQKTFSSQWEMTDESPSGQDKIKDENARRSHISEPRKRHARDAMTASWAMYDESPQDSNKANKSKGIHITGDGMGGNKNSTEKGWWEP